MRTIYRAPFILGITVLIGAQPAWAHVGQGAQTGFMHGLAHFFSGIDHIVSMLIAGVLAALLTKKTRASALFLSPIIIGFAFFHDVTLLGETGLHGFDFGFMSGAVALSMLSFALVRLIKPKILTRWRLRHGH